IDEWNMDTMQRVLNDEQAKARQDDGLKYLCNGLPVAVGVITVLVTAMAAWRMRRRGRSPTSAVQLPRDAFVLFGAFFTTYPFMHYDLAMFLLPTALLIDDAARRAWRPFDRRGEAVLGVVLLVCLILLGASAEAARFVEAPAAHPSATAADGSSNPA